MQRPNNKQQRFNNQRARPSYRPMFHKNEQGWISWLMENKIVMIILLIIFIIVVIPWLVCDVLGLKPICTIISGIFKLLGSFLKLIGLN